MHRIAGVLCLSLSILSMITAQAQTPKKGARVTGRAVGTFDVKLTPQKGGFQDPLLGRSGIDKQFHGDLEGTSQGEMLSAGTNVKGSAGYVAMEKVTGRLGGRQGTFILQHSATMTRGVPQLSITVVPDSGTGDLAGLTGRMKIKLDNGKHTYELEYALPDRP